jgi:signal peptidase I
VGVPGDLIQYSGSVFINGQEIPHSKILAIGFGNFGIFESWSVVVPNGQVWLMGPSSLRSFDGRYFGLIDRKKIMGIAHPLFSASL